ncbi:MAG: alpha/beta fold hydrolase [Myxococcales bacterium]|nr:alpha/beta fold hydrolase [Myxococcales bacterium]MCB9718474.1 alpha/beta fold hydrolase [Myxococcales bacterium]
MPHLDRRLVLGLLVLAACPRGEPSEVPEPAPLLGSGSRNAPEPEPSPAPTVPDGPLYYRGEIILPVGGPLVSYVELRPEGEGWVGTITIPVQGVYDAALGEIELVPGTLRFAIPAAGAHFEAGLVSDGTASECRFEQGGVELGCTLERVEESVLTAVRNPERPQTPKPPFPYDVVEVGYDNDTDGVHLAGTLTVPPGPGPYPAALLITGSGAQDRDESLMGHKPFWVLADDLTRRGIAVLRVDDRGVGGSTGDLSQSDGAALARDVAAGVAFLRAHERIDPQRVGLVGHSEGGILGPRVAAEDPKVAFVVMMAGTGVPGHAVIREQSVAILRANGAPADTIELVRNRQARAMEVVIGPADDDSARAQLEEMVGPRGASMVTPWFRSFARYDPAPALTKLRCPVLVLQGELDLQVLPEQNLPAIEAALKANRKRVTVQRLPGLNHLFQPANSGSPEEYAAIEQTLDPGVLTIIGEWIVAQTAAKAGRR